MDIDRLIGDGWFNSRLLFDDVASAQQDEPLIITEVDANGFFKGSFRGSDDQLIEGRFMQDGLRPRIVYTRRNKEGNVTTRYSGRVIELDGDTTVMIRGRFSRAETDAKGFVTLTTGDSEIEKPT